MGTFALLACNYTFRAGGGLPDHVRTIAILPFENETPRVELTQQLYDQLLRELPRALGVRLAGPELADAVVRGKIVRYALESPLYRPDASGQRAEVLQRQVTVAIQVEIIDQKQNMILWEQTNLSAQGQYIEATEPEEQGRDEAIRLLVQRIIDGAQSNW